MLRTCRGVALNVSAALPKRAAAARLVPTVLSFARLTHRKGLDSSSEACRRNDRQDRGLLGGDIDHYYLHLGVSLHAISADSLQVGR